MKQYLLNTCYKILAFLARTYIKKTDPYIVGINGSVWKTSCRMIVTDTIKYLLPWVHIYTSPKNFNGELGMSLSIFEIEKYTPTFIGMMRVLLYACTKTIKAKHENIPKVLVLEYGIDHPWEMAFLLSIAKPHSSIHTQIDAVHSMQFGDPQAIAKEEFLLQQHTRSVAFVNQDDPFVTHLTWTVPCDMISYSATWDTEWTIISIDTDSFINNDKVILWHTVQHAKIGLNNKKFFSLGINILWRFHLSYAAVWACLAEVISYAFFKKPCIQDADHLSLTLTLQPWRRSIFDWIYNSIVVDSTYNASPRSVKYIIHETVKRRNTQHPTHKILLVLWDMRELWTQEEKEHIKLAMFLQGIDAHLLLVGNVMNTVVAPYFERNWPGRLSHILTFAHFKECSDYLQSFLSQHQHEQYIVLCKWSQNTIFLEEVVASILLHNHDKTKLTRQWEWWEQKKNIFLTNALQQSSR